MKRISVIVPTYNEEKVIERCLKRLSNQTIPRDEYEIIVVDAPSSDRTRKIAKKYADKVIIQKSKGVGGARNDGVAVSKGKIIATTDADAIVPKNWLERIKLIENEDYLAVCGPLESLEDDFKSVFCVKILDTWGSFCNIIRIPLLCGTNTAIKRTIFLKIKGYRDLSMNDDVEIGLRILKQGKIKFDKNMRVKFSARRFIKKGMLKLFLIYLKEDINLILTNNTTTSYSKQKYD